MPPKHRQFAAYIAARRKERGLSLAELAERVGTTKSNIHAWEAGDWLPKANLLEALARSLGVAYEELFARAGYAHPEGLPAPAPYLRAKFRHLPDEALAEAERFFAELEERYPKKAKGGSRGKRAR
jgi:transcriptional regulator with XRE-family HTH domain